MATLDDKYDKLTFILPVNASDTLVRLQNINEVIRHSLSPDDVVTTYVTSNFLKIKTKLDTHTLTFDTYSDAIEALGLLMTALNTVGTAVSEADDLYLLLTGGELSGDLTTNKIILEEKTETFLPATTHTRLDKLVVDPTPPSGVIVAGVVELNRGASPTHVAGNLYNSVTDAGYVLNSTPSDTEWNSIHTDNVLYGHNNYMNIKSRLFGTFDEAVNYNADANYGLEFIMKIVSLDRYFKIRFDSWSTSGGGGFSYTSEEVVLLEREQIVFSDGSILNSAPVQRKEDDIVNYPGVAFVEPNGINEIAVVGDLNKPFNNIETASIASDYIYIKKGDYSGTINLLDGKTYHCESGVRFLEDFKFTDNSISVNCSITGHAVFDTNSEGFEFLAASNVTINVDEFNDVKTVCKNRGGGRVVINCNSILANCYNGGAYACDLRNDSELIINCPYIKSQHIFCYMLATPSRNYFELNTSEAEILDNYTTSYGNLAKSFVNIQGQNNNFLINANNIVNNHPVVTSTFGVNDGIIQIVNTNTNGGEYVLNSNIDGKTNYGISNYFGNASGKLKVNGTIRSNISPIKVDNNLNTGYNEMIFDNCTFIGQHLLIGEASKIWFKNCTFYNSMSGVGLYNIENINLAPILRTQLYFFNSLAEIEGTGEFISNGSFTDNFFVNMRGSESIGVGATDSFSGYQQIIGLNVPKF